MTEKQMTTLMSELRDINRTIATLSARMELVERTFFERYVEREYYPRPRGYIPEPETMETSFDVESLEMWARSHREEIQASRNVLDSIEIEPENASLLFNMYSYSEMSALASRALLSSCECGNQLQLLVERDVAYLTCDKCGRWLWSGLTKK